MPKKISYDQLTLILRHTSFHIFLSGCVSPSAVYHNLIGWGFFFLFFNRVKELRTQSSRTTIAPNGDTVTVKADILLIIIPNSKVTTYPSLPRIIQVYTCFPSIYY